MIVRRRSLLIGGAAGLGAAMVGCSTTSPATPPGVPTTTPAQVAGALSDIEARFAGRVGVHGVDTATGATVTHRADERFLMCSTVKVLLAAAVLRRSLDDPGVLGRRVRYTREELLEYAPVTTRNLAAGMTVAELCEAAITISDNTAANLLSAQVGGPSALTSFVRGLGDPLTRSDRTEPTLNDTGPGDERDTTTPSWFAHSLRALTLGSGTEGLPAPQRDRLVGWMLASTTGAAQIRAGTPAGWRVGDKTGSGAQGESHDVAVLWPPQGPPVVLTVFTAPVDPENRTGRATIAAVTTTVLDALGRTR